MSYRVNFFASNPALDNDDCNDSQDFATESEAVAVFNSPSKLFAERLSGQPRGGFCGMGDPTCEVWATVEHKTGEKVYHAPEGCDSQVLQAMNGHVDGIWETLATRCVQKATKAAPKTDNSDDEWRREIAREEGMMNGIDSYNDWMGY